MRKVLFTTVVFLGLLAGLCANDIVHQGNTNNIQTELEPNQEPLDDTVLNPLNRECLNHNAAWNYLWYGEAGVGRASLFLLEAGEYALESVYIADYSNTWVGLTEATATITVATTDADGTTLASIAEATMTTDGSVGEVTWENTTFELAQAGYVKVVVLSTTSAGDVNADGQEDFAPFLLSDDGSDPQGCGTDIDGVYSAGSYNWDIEFCASPTADPLPAVFFSEYAEGSSNNKYLEIYNGTDADVDLTGFAFPNVSNDPTEVGVYEYWNTFPEGATVAPGDVYVIGHGSADEIILAETDFTFTYLSNGDDGFCLVEGTEDSYVIVDCIGDWNGDPGSGWSVAGIENATQNHTLVRKDDVTEGNGGDWASSAGTNEDNSEWIVLDNEVWDYLGWHIDAPFDCDLNDLSIYLHDSYGDGWNGNVLTIGDLTFGLESGLADTTSACLEDGSYSVTCDGGAWQGEVSWEIQDAAGTVLLAAGAPYSGVLTLGESDDVPGCTDPDAVNYNSDATVDDGSCYYAGDSCNIAIEYTGDFDGLDPVTGATTYAGDVEWYSF
ncbi:MAG: hypothetical protein CMG68_04780, partial [Candidatus Marinimicrobia bacterium]|nr:hypothetical protein [Candidatus Neomarinimicrobiota bacterium]